MDWTTIIVGLGSAIISGGSIAGLVFFKENKRARQLENETTASAQWRELYEKAEGKIDSQGVKIEQQYKENKLLREENNNLSTQNAVLKLWKCNKIVCADRQPPFGVKNKQENE